jgi:tRNA-Thr(GGU) m(6)t(6)A37 methyltransferase TsaA
MTLQPIGLIETPFDEKFGVPRQSMMIKEAKGVIRLNQDPRYLDAIKELSSFSHIWVLFLFHKSGAWHPLIDTPRVLDHKIGVFATRSPHRPNSIGMSCVKLDKVEVSLDGKIEVHVSGVDILNGTPVLDIKPYISYADVMTDATSGWIDSEIESYPVEFSSDSLAALEKSQELKPIIEQMLALDPRPTSQKRAHPLRNSNHPFAFRIKNLDIHWHAAEGRVIVDRIVEM